MKTTKLNTGKGTESINGNIYFEELETQLILIKNSIGHFVNYELNSKLLKETFDVKKFKILSNIPGKSSL